MSSQFRKPLEAALGHALNHLEGLDDRPVSARTDLATLRRRLGKALGDESIPAEAVIDELVCDVDGAIIGSASGRFFAWVVGGALPAALAADWLTSAWDQNSALYASGPAAAVVEEVAGGWLKEILRLPSTASFALTTGCQMAHVTCLAAARHSLLAERGWDVEEQGLFGAPRIRIFSGGRHGSIERALRLVGFGRGAVTELGVDSRGALKPEALEDALQSDPGAPAIVLLQAGDINTGGYDPFATLIPIARRYGAWAHVDGAFGLWAGASPRYRHLLAGADAADSWTADGHKWLNTPFDCGYAFVARAEAHRAAMSHRAPYLAHAVEARDQMDWTPEWSRRGRGFATYAALRQLGRHGAEDLVDRCCANAAALVNGIRELPGAEVLSEPLINQGLVRFLDPAHGAYGADHDRRTEAVIEGVVAGGEAFFAGTTWLGMRAMRVSVCNWQTNAADVNRAARAIAGVLRAL